MKKILLSVALLCAFGFQQNAKATIHSIGVGPQGNPIFVPPAFTMPLGDTVVWNYLGTTTSYNIVPVYIPLNATPFTMTIGPGSPVYFYVPGYSGNYQYSCPAYTGMTGQFTVTCSVPSATASGASVVCQGKNDTLTVTTTGGSNYKWKMNGSAISGATNSTYLATAAGSYTCTVKNSCGDSATTNAINVTTSSMGTPNITEMHTNNVYNFTGTATGATNWSWDFGDMGTSTLQNPTHTYTATGAYVVNLVATNANGCTGVKAYTVNITSLGINSVSFENNVIVSPNPINDHFSLNIADEHATLSIYDLSGRFISTPKQIAKSANGITYDIGNVTSGMYILKLRSGDNISGKMISVIK